MFSFTNATQAPAHEIKCVKTKLLNVCSASLVASPSYYSSADQTRVRIVAAADAVVVDDPEFLLKAALYVRDDLNIRSTANFLLALAAAKPECRPFLKKYFDRAVRLPTDLTQIFELHAALGGAGGEGRVPIPSALRKCAAAKLARFSIYQIGKYANKTGKKSKKPKAAKACGGARNRGRPYRTSAPLAGMQLAADAEAESRPTMSLKQLVRVTHASEPKQVVMSLLGKRYPDSPEAFAAAGLGEEADFVAAESGRRMRVPVPVTWETQLSARGNTAATWEALIEAKQLPFMAMLRNLRNLLTCRRESEGAGAGCGVSAAAHEAVLARLTDEQQVAGSRQFPFRFLSAYEVVGELLGEGSLGGGYYGMQQQPRRRNKKGGGGGGGGGDAMEVVAAAPEPALLRRYRAALETAIRIATTRNVKPIRGKSVVFVDVSGSMQCAASGGAGGLGSVRTCADIAILMGLMLKYVCQECDLRIFSSPGGYGYGHGHGHGHGHGGAGSRKCHLPVHLDGDGILSNFGKVRAARAGLGGGTDFPFDYLEDMIAGKSPDGGVLGGGGGAPPRIDNFFILSDMMIAPGRMEMGGPGAGGYSATSGSAAARAGGVSGVLREFRRAVNPDLLFVSVDLKGQCGRSTVELEDGAPGAHPNDVLVTGYSDEILRYVVERKGAQAAYVDRIDAEKGLRAGAAGGAPGAGAKGAE